MTPAPHRLILAANELAYLVEKTGVDLPPDWRPTADIGPAESGLTKKKVVTGVGDEAEVHPSVRKNLEILGGPTVMLDTVASIGDRSSHSVHVVAGPLGASLFALGDGAVEMSMFASVDLGKELIRAVPPEAPREGGIDSRLGGGDTEPPLSGRLPLAALQEMGAARLFRAADPDAPAAVLAQLDLSGPEAELAEGVANQTDGALRCLVISNIGTSQVNWVHTAGGWSGLDPEPDGTGRRMVRIAPAAREDLGTWVAPAVAGALA